MIGGKHYFFQYLLEYAEVIWFFNIHICPAEECIFDVLFRCGSRIDGDGDVVVIFIISDFLQAFDTIFPGHVKIEKKKMGQVTAMLMKVFHKLHTVVHGMHIGFHFQLVECFFKKETVAFVIIGKKNIEG